MAAMQVLGASQRLHEQIVYIIYYKFATVRRASRWASEIIFFRSGHTEMPLTCNKVCGDLRRVKANLKTGFNKTRNEKSQEHERRKTERQTKIATSNKVLPVSSFLFLFPQFVDQTLHAGVPCPRAGAEAVAEVIRKIWLNLKLKRPKGTKGSWHRY